MLTATSPANWEQIYLYAPETGELLDGGRLFHSHREALRRRLTRFLKRHGILSNEWSALWFLEFQKRGAPHVHLILFGAEIPEPVRRQLRAWFGRAWSSIVGNPDPVEQQKHQRAGTQVARMRCKHFGYAAKYAKKAEQKLVPPEFKRVGRFWGVWNDNPVPPVELSFDFNLNEKEHEEFIIKLAYSALTTISSYSPGFFAKRLEKIGRVLVDKRLKHSFSFSVYGSAASKAVLGVFE